MKLTSKELNRRIRSWAVAVAGVFLLLLVCGALDLFGYLVMGAGGLVAGFILGRLGAGQRPNARSLAQRNRHLNRQLDATRAKLEAEMERTDRAEKTVFTRAN